PFVVSFIGREDRGLTEKLLTELPGILNWALDGLARLRARGRFEEPAVSLEAKTRMLYQSDPVRGFIEECCVIEPGAEIEKRVFYPLYQEFCQVNGTHAVPLPTLTERLSEIYPAVVASKRRRSDGSRPPIFSGVRLNDPSMVKVYKTDPALIALGMEGAEAVECDADGFPIPKPLAFLFDDE
ncbi:MAG: primase-like DNA-binding domain-containing protein, partial [Minisyncoccia bacterium]